MQAPSSTATGSDGISYSMGGLAHVRSTVLWQIIPEIAFFTAVAAGLCWINVDVTRLELPTTLITVFGTVLGFLVSFRTSSAFASYSEGRRYWSSIILACRSFARIAWLHVPNYVTVPAELDGPFSDDEKRRGLVEKKSAINLVAAFAIATQHYCRGEAGIYYEDLYPLVCYLPRYRLPTSSYITRPDLDPLYTSEPSALETLSAAAMASFSASGSTLAARSPLLSRQDSFASGVTSFEGPDGRHVRGPSWTQVEERIDPLSGSTINKIKSPHKLLPPRNPPPFAWDSYVPFYAFFRDLFSFASGQARNIRHEMHKKDMRAGKKKRAPILGQKDGENVPLEITLLLSGWVAALQRRKTVDVPTINSLLGSLQSFTDSLTGLERVLLSPIPIQYSLHLRHVIWLYLFFLPSQIYSTFGWITVPAIAITTFCFIGFLQIGNEIENPLGYDASDLDLESFTQIILKELREICAHPVEEADPANFMFVDANLPFATGPEWQGKSAVQIMHEQVPVDFLEARLRAGGGQPAAVNVRSRHTARPSNHPYTGSATTSSPLKQHTV